MILRLQGRPFNLAKSVFSRFYGAGEVLSTNILLKDGSKCENIPRRITTCLSVTECAGLKPKVAAVNDEDLRPSPTTGVSFHGRKLPGHLTSLESEEGQALFHAACGDGRAKNFFSLITNFASQSDVSMCGPASLAMVLNAMKLDPLRTWRRPWRWWSDEMFACCEESLLVMKSNGVTLEFFDRIARKQPGIIVDTRPPGSLEEFKKVLCRSAITPDEHVIVSFERKSLGQTGIGHFSPIAAVHEALDLVLILDVARFKYPPYWVRIPDLHEAMKGIDPDTGLSRGFSLISRNPKEQ